MPKREVPSWLARADACVLPIRTTPSSGALPNKAFDYLGAGAPDRRVRPVGRADPDGRARRLRRGGAARGRPGAGGAIRRLAADREAARGWARAAGYALAHYDRAALAAASSRRWNRLRDPPKLGARAGGRAGQAGDRPGLAVPWRS